MQNYQPRTNKVIIFDWDDTICPSSFVDQFGINTYKDLPLHTQNLLHDICICAKRCLEAAAKYGQVIIITNSDDGWVLHSAKRFLPNLLPILPKYRIFSARTRYEKYYPDQPLCWKAAAFGHQVNVTFATVEDDTVTRDSFENNDFTDSSQMSFISLDSTHDSSECSQTLGSVMSNIPRREIISFGDSMDERTAVKIVSHQLGAISKSVLFIACPTPMQIIGQLTMLADNMKYVCENTNSLDLEISPYQAKKCAETFLKRGEHDIPDQVIWSKHPKITNDKTIRTSSYYF